MQRREFWKTCALALAVAMAIGCGDDSSDDDSDESMPDAGAAPDAGDDGAADASADERADTGESVTVDMGPTMLPLLPDACPDLATGVIDYGELEVHLWVGERAAGPTGPILIYYHGTGGNGSNAARAVPQATRDELLSLGGLLISPTGTVGTGSNTGNNVWYTGDFEVVDDLIACAIDQLNIDTRRIFATGSSAGGLQASVMAYQRSGYLAAVVPDSGGIIFTTQRTQQDETHLPAAMTLHGMMGVDVVLVDFAVQSRTFYEDIVERGGFAVNCDHGGGHVRSPPDLDAAAWRFMMDHPFGVDPEPYVDGLPDSFPDYCVIIE